MKYGSGAPAEANRPKLGPRLALLDLGDGLLGLLPGRLTRAIFGQESWEVDLFTVQHALLDYILAVEVVWHVDGSAGSLGILVCQDLVVVCVDGASERSMRSPLCGVPSCTNSLREIPNTSATKRMAALLLVFPVTYVSRPPMFSILPAGVPLSKDPTLRQQGESDIFGM